MLAQIWPFCSPAPVQSGPSTFFFDNEDPQPQDREKKPKITWKIIFSAFRQPLSTLMIEEEDSKVKPTHPPPPFLEVICRSLGKTSRFAAGTKAGFAVSLINKKLDVGAPLVFNIDAVKDGEEPISFGPDAVLVDYGNGWKLQTATELDYGEVGVGKAEHEKQIPTRIRNFVSSDGSHPATTVAKPGIGFLYIAKILIAFVLIFALGAMFTLALENLPRFILFINSFM